MQLPREYILRLSDVVASVNSPLMAVHLSDMDITEEFATELLNVYQIEEIYRHDKVVDEHLVSSQIKKEFKK
jgi:hypothetical protein